MSHDVPQLHKTRRSTDFQAQKLGKGSSGGRENQLSMENALGGFFVSFLIPQIIIPIRTRE